MEIIDAGKKMRIIPSRCCGLLATVICIVAALFVGAGTAVGQESHKRVLLLFDEDTALPGLASLDQSLRSTFSAGLNADIEFLTESMNLSKFNREHYEDVLSSYYLKKYRDRKPDLIVAVMGPSLAFLLRHGDTIFPGIPVVFCGIDPSEIENIRLPPRITGILVRRVFAPTLEVVFRLQPQTKHVFVVGGTSTFDQHLVAAAQREFQPFERRASFTYLTDLSMRDLLAAVSRLPQQSVVLYLTLFRDAAGDSFVPHDAVHRISVAANAPVYVFVDQYLGQGPVGGYLYSVKLHGKSAAEMGLRVQSGESPGAIPIRESQDSAHMFDWLALRRWGLKESDLPPSSIVLNRQPGFWELYKQYILVGISVFLAQTMAILGLLWQRGRRKRVEAELRRTEEKFSKSFRQSPLAITIVNTTDGRYIEVNETFEYQTGWSREEVIGRSALDINLWVDPNERSFFIKRLLANGHIRDFEARFRRKDGPIRTALGSAEMIEVNGEPCALSVIADITERKQAEEALVSLSGRLIEAQEAERKRIARELHDDYNQRIAMIAIDLEGLAGNSSADDVGERLRELFNRISEVGEDLHSLSHTLHSSTLENLGLVAGVKAFCVEFAEQQGVEVDFANENIPRAIPADVALCLLRIVQEALRNVKRHSGVKKAEVCLEQLDGRLHLSVSDRGRGFDSNKPSAERGIGIHSMEERLRFLGGRLEIQSRPMAGTRIDAWLPLNIANAA